MTTHRAVVGRGPLARPERSRADDSHRAAAAAAHDERDPARPALEWALTEALEQAAHVRERLHAALARRGRG